MNAPLRFFLCVPNYISTEQPKPACHAGGGVGLGGRAGGAARRSMKNTIPREVRRMQEETGPARARTGREAKARPRAKAEPSQAATRRTRHLPRDGLTVPARSRTSPEREDGRHGGSAIRGQVRDRRTIDAWHPAGDHKGLDKQEQVCRAGRATSSEVSRPAQRRAGVCPQAGRSRSAGPARGAAQAGAPGPPPLGVRRLRALRISSWRSFSSAASAGSCSAAFESAP